MPLKWGGSDLFFSGVVMNSGSGLVKVEHGHP